MDPVGKLSLNNKNNVNRKQSMACFLLLSLPCVETESEIAQALSRAFILVSHSESFLQSYHFHPSLMYEVYASAERTSVFKNNVKVQVEEKVNCTENTFTVQM